MTVITAARPVCLGSQSQTNGLCDQSDCLYGFCDQGDCLYGVRLTESGMQVGPMCRTHAGMETFNQEKQGIRTKGTAIGWTSKNCSTSDVVAYFGDDIGDHLRVVKLFATVHPHPSDGVYLTLRGENGQLLFKIFGLSREGQKHLPVYEYITMPQLSGMPFQPTPRNRNDCAIAACHQYATWCTDVIGFTPDIVAVEGLW